MTTVASFRNFELETTCVKCGEALIAPEWSKFVSDGGVLNLWSCPKCRCRFETKMFMAADAESAADCVAIKTFFPPLLVA
jgi:predicted nucleic-acid-binding Zn-ribbon protein